MRIKGFYILSRRSIARMIAILGIALWFLHSEATDESNAKSRRVEDAQVELIRLKRRLPEDSSRTQLPDVQYIEYKSVYLEAKRYKKEYESGNPITARRDASPHHAARREASPHPQRAGRPSPSKAVTKADLRAAVNTILHGEDVNAAKPGPRLTPAKRRQIEAAKNYRATHCGCTLHNACIRSFVPASGGYRSAKALYVVLTRKGNN